MTKIFSARADWRGIFFYGDNVLYARRTTNSTRLAAKKIRDAKAGEKLVTLEEIILNDKGIPLFMQTSGASTENLTVLEAALAAQETLTLSLFPAP